MEPGGLQRLWPVRLGLAGQRLGLRRDGPTGVLRHDRDTTNPHSAARGWHLDRSDRAVIFDLFELVARGAEERYEDSLQDTMTRFSAALRPCSEPSPAARS